MIRKSGNRFSRRNGFACSEVMLKQRDRERFGAEWILVRVNKAGQKRPRGNRDLQPGPARQGHNPVVLVNYSPTICLNPPSDCGRSREEIPWWARPIPNLYLPGLYLPGLCLPGLG